MNTIEESNLTELEIEKQQSFENETVLHQEMLFITTH